MKLSVLLFFPLLALAALNPRAAALGKITGDSVNVQRWANNSGGRVSGGSYALNSSIGEAAYSAAAGGAFQMKAGYNKLAFQPGSVIAITAVTKSTGSLELDWSAPGADGFLGSVSGGIYRLDYSSDSAHAFSPVNFVTEFSTSVTPGETQRLTLNGLQPDTTYYTRIYLGDETRVLAEDSARSAESTLADLPVDPAFSSISPCKVTISWTVPNGGAAGYRTDSSTTSFGILSPGGDIRTVSTPDGLKVSLTVSGLLPVTRYYFRVASLNWQGDKNFTAVLTTVTASGTCVAPIYGLSAAADALTRAVKLTWINPSSPAPEGVVITLSTSPAPAEISDGAGVTFGQILADGSVVRSTSAADSISETGLTLDTTIFYHLMAKYAGPVYSVGVSTGIFLDLPPMAPAGLTAVRNSAGTAVQLSWTPVSSNLDGSAFAGSTPRGVELAHYRIEKATSVASPSWVAVATLPVNANSYTDVITAADPACIYRIASVDTLGSEEPAMAVDAAQSVYIFSSKQVAMLKVPKSLSGEMLAAGNSAGANVLIRSVDETTGGEPNVYSSVRFEAVKSPGNEVLGSFKFSRPELTVSLGYQTSGGKVVSQSALSSVISASDAAQRLGLYWNNGEKYVKLYGKVDTVSQLLTVETSLTGSYQVRSIYRDAGVHFDISNLSNKAITPNGDGLNDAAVFTFDNPRDSAFNGKIYSLNGSFVADMTAGPVSNSLKWDGKAGGRAVAGGVYVYQITAEGKTFNGTLLVIK